MLARDPDDLPLYEELGYVYAALGDTNRAVEWFKKAIDAQRRIADTAAEREHVVRLQGEVARMSKRFDFAAYLAYRSSSRQPATGTAGPIGGTLPSQSGVELAYQPPMIGFRDERIFQVFGRLLWNFEPGSLELDDDSLQAGVGIRYKPLKTQNLFLSAERLIAIGDAALDDWLLRALYSWEYAPVTRPHGSLSNYTTLFGYFVDHSIWALYGEARQGVTWHAASKVLVTPHVVLDARYQDSRGPTDSFVEGGAGVSLRYLFNESQYEGYRSSAELLLQYKAGRFFERSHAGPDDDFHGLVITGVLRF
jgi:tetratricopeptide (TPR) repeat protein